MPRTRTYAQAIQEATAQAMALSPDVVVLGQLVDSPAGIFGTTKDLPKGRCQDFPVAENLMTAVAMGMSLTGKRPIIVHQRLDFMLYSMDQIVNWLALWRFKSDRQSNMPVVIRAIVGKGWGQGPQHSKSLHAWFAHVPGLRVVMPATAADAKGLLLEAIFGEGPTIMIEHRSLFDMTDHVPEQSYRIRFGHAIIRRPGSDVTIVALGSMVPIAMKAAAVLAKQGISAEVIDPRTISPLDEEAIVASAQKTGHLVVCDPAWRTGSFAAEILAAVHERLSIQSARVTLPDSHTPMSQVLEAQYYVTAQDIVRCVKALLPAKRAVG